jgi:hypothetical protein
MINESEIFGVHLRFLPVLEKRAKDCSVMIGLFIHPYTHMLRPFPSDPFTYFNRSWFRQAFGFLYSCYSFQVDYLPYSA